MTQDALSLREPASAGIRDRLLLLRSLEILTDLPDDGLALLAEHAINRRYRAGDVLAEPGALVSGVHILLEGSVLSTRNAVTTRVTRGGWGIGMLELFAGLPTGLAVAESTTRTLEIPAAALRMALEENFPLVRSALRLMGTEVRLSRHNLPADPEHPPATEMGTYYERPRTLTERMIELRASPMMFSNFDALVDFSRRTVEFRVPPGHVFWTHGEPSTHAIHVKYGRVRSTAPDGRNVVTASDFTLGVMDLWSGQKRSYEARTETLVIGYRVEFEAFLTVVETHAQVALNMLAWLARALLGEPSTLPPRGPYPEKR